MRWGFLPLEEAGGRGEPGVTGQPSPTAWQQGPVAKETSCAAASQTCVARLRVAPWPSFRCGCDAPVSQGRGAEPGGRRNTLTIPVCSPPSNPARQAWLQQKGFPRPCSQGSRHGWRLKPGPPCSKVHNSCLQIPTIADQEACVWATPSSTPRRGCPTPLHTALLTGLILPLDARVQGRTSSACGTGCHRML